MHIIEAYALGAGVKIDRPIFQEEPYDGLPDKFILLNPHSKGISRFYSKWQDVVNLIQPRLKEQGVSILQLDTEDKAYEGCVKLPPITFNQSFCVVRKSIMLLGIDSFCMHISDALNKPMVILYAGNAPFNHSRPYFGDYAKYRFFIPDMMGKKHTYSFTQGQEYINQHEPEKIAEAVFELLNLQR
jgi:ADP-heptose:LPS heptosyltransferase